MVQAVIAVVDDDAGMRDALAELIEVLDFDSRPFSGGESFLAEFAPGRFDCVLSDVRMPGMDGFELKRRLRELESDLPVIFVTSYDDGATRSRALAMGARAALAKPVNADDLIAQIRRAIGERN